jgi:hypothetical protein
MPDGRTRATTWAPRRAYYVLRYLKRQLAPGKPRALSNKQIQTAIGFGSEGEVSQIMRWLCGELPTLGRWAYGYLNAPQTYRFIDRERTPAGGYLITLLATPTPIDQVEMALPQIVQLSFLDDPSMIPHAAHQDAPQGGSFFHDPLGDADLSHQERQNARSQGDHPKESHEESDQEEESARSPLFERLIAQPGMDWPLARRIVANPVGTLSEFESDLALAQTFARSPFFFTVAKWRDGQRVLAPEVCHERPRSAAPARTRRGSQPNRPAPTADPATDPEYTAYLAECLAAPKAKPGDFAGLPMRREWGVADGG